ncbi:hypothetical protein [Streptomyces sp. KHY 26]|uniref:hypothetical protein n=1 Tax=Streptomyces sp. KHY 26 TaxID=3097359 RepID=UPI00376F02F5
MSALTSPSHCLDEEHGSFEVAARAALAAVPPSTPVVAPSSGNHALFIGQATDLVGTGSSASPRRSESGPPPHAARATEMKRFTMI